LATSQRYSRAVAQALFVVLRMIEPDASNCTGLARQALFADVVGIAFKIVGSIGNRVHLDRTGLEQWIAANFLE